MSKRIYSRVAQVTRMLLVTHNEYSGILVSHNVTTILTKVCKFLLDTRDTCACMHIPASVYAVSASDLAPIYLTL